MSAGIMKVLCKILIVSSSFFLLFVLMRFFLFDWYVVGSSSMQPTLNSGDIVFISKVSKVRRNDLAVFYLEDNLTAVVKRCVAIPGDTICMENGYLKLGNGEWTGLLQSQKKLSYMSEETGVVKNFSPIYLPQKKESNPHTEEIYTEDYYFFCGDNLIDSFDSRNYGPVPFSRIEGRVVFKF
jgi:signal peptidase I